MPAMRKAYIIYQVNTTNNLKSENMNGYGWNRFVGGLLVGGLMAACTAAPETESVNAAALNRYKAVLTTPPVEVPTTKTPDAALAGNGDLGITLGGTPDLFLYWKE